MNGKCTECGRPLPPDGGVIWRDEVLCPYCMEAVFHLLEKEGELPFDMPFEAPRKEKEKKEEAAIPFLTPEEIYRGALKDVVGQEEAKWAVATAFALHLLRLKEPIPLSPHLLLIGPTGSGKTYMVRKVAEWVGLPFTHVSATSFTQAGYVGDDVETILSRLAQSARWRLKLAEKGVVFIDEFDKIARKSGRSRSTDREVNGEGVQHALLRMIEGAELLVPKNLGGNAKEFKGMMRTDRILFVFAGAFEGLTLSPSREVGFTGRAGAREEPEPRLKDVVGALEEYGIIPEILGRIGAFARLNPLTVEEIYRILTGPGGILLRYRKAFARFGIELFFTPEELWRMAEEVHALGLGARGIKAVVWPRMVEAVRRTRSSAAEG